MWPHALTTSATWSRSMQQRARLTSRSTCWSKSTWARVVAAFSRRARRGARRQMPLVEICGCGAPGVPGSAQHIRNVGERREAITRAVERVRATTQLLSEAGLACTYVTGAGTGSYMFERRAAFITSCRRARTYHGCGLRKNEWTESGIPQFEHSLFVDDGDERTCSEPGGRRRRTQGVEHRLRYAAVADYAMSST